MLSVKTASAACSTSWGEVAYKGAPGFLGATAGTNSTAELAAPAWVIF